MKKTYACLLIVIAVFCSTKSIAQTEQSKTPEKKDAVAPKDAKEVKKYPEFARTSLDLSLGTRGVGFTVKYRISQVFSVRLGGSYLPLTYSTPLTLSGYHTDVALENNFTGFQLFGEYRPFKKAAFKIIAGFGYFTTAQLNCKLTPTGNYAFGNITVSPDVIGEVNAKIDWKGVAPFFGFGFGKAHPKRKVGVSIGVGIYFLSAPTVTVTGTNFLTGNDKNAQVISDNIDDLRYLPVVNLHLNYRFKK